MVRISEIVSQNPWWKHGKGFVGHDRLLSKARDNPIFFTRRDFETIKENIYVIRGCRQVGKTTYLKEMIRKLIEEGFDPQRILYLSLDFFVSRRELRNAVNYFLDINKEAEDLYIFLDEITSIQDWNLELKYLSDSGAIKRTKIIATGSSSVALRRKGELLPGRGLEGNEYYIKPLSYREFVLQTVDHIKAHVEEREFYDSLDRIKTNLNEITIDLNWHLDRIYEQASRIAPFKKELEYLLRIYLTTGGFPQVVNDYLRKFAEKKVDPTLGEMLVRNILGDVAKLGKQETFARQILREIMNKYGTRYSFRKLAGDIESTHPTTIDYLELLEESFILRVLHSYDFNKKDMKFKGDKKVYLQDPFIFYSLESFLTGKNLNDVIAETLQDEKSLSEIIEGIVCSHLIMNKEVPILREPKTFLWFYYDTRGREINHVLRTDESYLGIEVKYQSGVSFKDISTVSQVKKYIILSKEDLGKEENILIVPVELFLALLGASSNNL